MARSRFPAVENGKDRVPPYDSRSLSALASPSRSPRVLRASAGRSVVVAGRDGECKPRARPAAVNVGRIHPRFPAVHRHLLWDDRDCYDNTHRAGGTLRLLRLKAGELAVGRRAVR
jgi:hypothetical protein